MKLKNILMAALFSLTLVCCQSTQQRNLDEWTALVERIEVDEELTNEQLKEISDEYERLSNETQQIMNDFTKEERQELGRLQARYLKGYAKHTAKDLFDSFKGILDVAGGFVKELTNSIDTEELGNNLKEGMKNLYESLDTTALNEMVKSGKEEMQNLASSVDKQDLEKIATGLSAIGAELSGVLKENIDINELKKNMTEEDVRNIAGSITKEDIEALKKSITKEDIKKLKESLSDEEIQRLKNLYKDLNKQ